MMQEREPARILIADDEDIFLKPTALYLGNQGYACTCVRSAEEAALALGNDSYDLLIIDINMPGNTNLEFLKDKNQRSEFLPVIVVTGFPTVTTAVESFRLAVVDYRTKPLDFPEFLDTVRGAIEKGRVVRVMRKARQGFGVWLDQMKQMETALLTSNDGDAGQTSSVGEFDWYLGEAVQRFAGLSMSLMNAVQSIKERTPENRVDVCSLMNCSRLAAYEASIREAVNVLVRTKNSFKSKELADVRKMLESALQRGTVAGNGSIA